MVKKNGATKQFQWMVTRTAFEVVAVTCFALGFALFIAFDRGWVGSRGVASVMNALPGPTTATSELADRLKSRLARVKNLEEKIDTAELQLKERAASLSQIKFDLDGIAKRIGEERRVVNDLTSMTVEIETERESLHEKNLNRVSRGALRSVSGLEQSSSEFRNILRKATELGISAEQVGEISWRNDTYFRMKDAFEFQDDSIYLRMKGIDKVNAIAAAVSEDDQVNAINVVYRQLDDHPSLSDEMVERHEMARERALVLKNQFRDVLGREFDISVSKIDSSQVDPGSVEVWIGGAE